MGNFKVRVNSEVESREVQELFFQIGGSWSGYKKIYDWPEIKQLYLSENYITFSNDINFFVKDSSKEITLPELRDMVKPMREYLDANRNYEFVLSTEKDDGFIEIPEGAEVATICRNYIIFWKDEKYSFSVSEENKWCYKSCDDSRYFSLGEYMNEYGDVSIIWQRESEAESLVDWSNVINNAQQIFDHENASTPSLNDQYAEIEQVRQAIKVPDGNDSNHALDAMGVGRDKVRQHRHYFIDVSDVDEIDFYEIALRYNVTDPCIQHILKKCLAVGQRGQKDFNHDLKDIHDTAKRMLGVHGLDS